MKKYFSEYFHNIYECDIPKNSFLVNNIEYDVPCIFQIWQKKDIKRLAIDKLKPNGFIFVSKNDKPDIAFRRVGVNAGNISKEIKEKNIQTHYFIKFINNKSIDTNIDNLKKIVFENNNTVGPKSISKQELIKEYNKYI